MGNDRIRRRYVLKSMGDPRMYVATVSHGGTRGTTTLDLQNARKFLSRQAAYAVLKAGNFGPLWCVVSVCLAWHWAESREV